MGRNCPQGATWAPYGAELLPTGASWAPLGPLWAGIPSSSLHMAPLGPYRAVFSKPCCSVCCVASQGLFFPPENHFFGFPSLPGAGICHSKPPRGWNLPSPVATCAALPRRGVFFHPENHFLGFPGVRAAGGRAAGGWHAGARESLSLLLSLHSLHISHTQNRYPALRGDQCKLHRRCFPTAQQPLRANRAK